jgi:hypothetical protein
MPTCENTKGGHPLKSTLSQSCGPLNQLQNCGLKQLRNCNCRPSGLDFGNSATFSFNWYLRNIFYEECFFARPVCPPISVSVPLFVCLSASLSTYLYVCPPSCLSVHLPVLPVHLSVCLSICLPASCLSPASMSVACWSVCDPPICPLAPVCLSTGLPVCICPPVLSVYLLVLLRTSPGKCDERTWKKPVYFLLWLINLKYNSNQY